MSHSIPSAPREFDFSDQDFQRVARIIHATAGISLVSSKADLVYSRLAKLVRCRDLKNFSQYIDLLEQGNKEDLSELTNAMTTNVTSFLREGYHFDTLCEEVLNPVLEEGRAGQRIRIWSAACSTGEEPYSAVINAIARCPLIDRADFKVLATDLDSEAIATAERAVYAESLLEPLPLEWRRRFTLLGKGRSAGNHRIRSEVSQHITFRTLNLMHQWPIKGPFDAIFCRNVMIYFDQETRVELVERFRKVLKIGGYLFIGHSETLPDHANGFVSCGRTTYTRTH